MAQFCLCLAVLTYDSGRHYDEWDFTSYIVAVVLVVVITPISLFAFFTRKEIENKKILAYLFLSIVLAITAPIGSYYAGRYLWGREVVRNEKTVLGVAKLLDEYKTEHGQYPDSLYQIGKGELILPRGVFKEKLRYDESEDHFTLSIPYGWYSHTYDSKTGQWWWTD